MDLSYLLDHVGFQLRDADLDVIIHYFVYNADYHASLVLDSGLHDPEEVAA